jgi:hypothetical protein
MPPTKGRELPIIGWREYLSLPELNVKSIKVKVDTGARSSSLHAFDVERYTVEGISWVKFCIHPRQRDQQSSILAHARVEDIRTVRSSTGQTQQRLVISTSVELLGMRWPIELTLANRDQMGFRMLLGRQATRGRLLVDPGRSYCARQS